MLNHLGISKTLISFHAHNEHEKAIDLIASLQNGISYALISDAGTPLIRDPGFSLVRAVQAQGINVIPIPGPCALIAALSAAGVPCDEFFFAGFLPVKQAARQQKLQLLRSYGHTIALYEATHRIVDCIKDIVNIYGSDYSFVLAKELTKVYEYFFHGTGIQVNQWLQDGSGHEKGEFVLILPATAIIKHDTKEVALLTALLRELPLTKAVKIVSEFSTISKNKLYKIALSIAH